MLGIPRRHSLVSQTATIIREGVAKGDFREWLPGERALCETLQVSRNTLRAALAQLKREGLLQSTHGSGNRIVAPVEPAKRMVESRDVALLSPEALERLRPSQTLWIDSLRAMLSERGCRLHSFHGAQYFRGDSSAALVRLVNLHPHGCWILLLSNENMQRWFEQRRIPCVVGGSVFAGHDLPFRDLDHRAICRHAAGAMLGLGHRKVAFLTQRSRRAGDLESEAGFLETVRGSRHGDAEATVCCHDGSVGGIGRALGRLLERKPHPTALLVANPYHYLTVVTRLQQLGLRVPQDISVVSRDEDPFLQFLVPAPARYVASPQLMARSLLRPVLELLAGGIVTHRSIRLMPDFHRGESLAPPPR